MRPVWLVALLGCDSSSIAHGPRALYQVTHERVPTSGMEAIELGLDVNGGGGIDNELGVAFGLLVREQFGDPQAGTDQALASGQLRLTFEVEIDTDVHGLANVTAYPTSIDDVAAPDPIADPLVGSLDQKLISVGPGQLPLVIAPFGVPVVLPLDDAYAQFIDDGVELHGVVGGDFDPAIVHEQLFPQWRDAVTAIIARDCVGPPPTCGCATGSPGELAIDSFDTDHDCAITTDELEQYPLVQSALTPDIGPANKPTRLSVGVGIDATILRRL